MTFQPFIIIRFGPPGGHHSPPYKVRLPDDVRGTYGQAAGVVTGKRHRPGNSTTWENA